MKDPNELTAEQMKQKLAFEEKLKEVHNMKFTKGQLLVIFNILTKIQFVYGDFLAVDPIIKMIQPIAAADSNATPEQTAKAEAEALRNHVMTGKKSIN